MSTATSEQSVVDSVNKQLFIGGEWRDASGGNTLAVEDPSTAEPLCEVADGTPDDAMAALASADEAKAEITYAAEFFRWFSEEAVRIEGRYAIPPAGAGRMLTMKQPVGPCLFIT